MRVLLRTVDVLMVVCRLVQRKACLGGGRDMPDGCAMCPSRLMGGSGAARDVIDMTLTCRHVMRLTSVNNVVVIFDLLSALDWLLCSTIGYMFRDLRSATFVISCQEPML